MAPWVRPSPPLLPQRWPAFSSSSPSFLIFLLLPSHPPHCLPHPSEVNSSETFLGSNFHFSLRPLRRPGSVLSGSVQQERQLTPACNSRGDRWGGGATPGITIRAGRPFGMPAQAARFAFHIGVIKTIFHAGPYLLSRPNIQMQPFIGKPHLPPARYHFLRRKWSLTI